METVNGSADGDHPQRLGDGTYRLLFERSPLPMWVYDTDSLRILAVNATALEAYGYAEHEFLAMSILDLRPPSEHDALITHLAQQRPALVNSGLWRHRKRNGDLIDVDITVETIAFAGRPARLVLARDVTAQRRQQAALRESERRFRHIVETATEGIWTIDARGVTDFVNPAMAAMLGYGPAEMLGRHLTEFMDADGRRAAEENLARRRQGVSEVHEFRFRRRDGTDLWTRVATNPVLDDDGAYAGALAMVTDITERRAMDQQLKLLASSVARFNDLVVITEAEPLDEPGPRILFVNEAFERRTGWRRDEVIGRSPRFLQGRNTDPRTVREIGEALRRWQPVHCEIINYTRDGEEFWLEMDIVPIADDTGWYTHWVSVEHDITGRKRRQRRDASRTQALTLIAAGAPLSDVLDEIARGAASPWPGDDADATAAEAERLKAIAIERKRADSALRESQKMESLGTLAGGIAHDFNNILGAILGNLALVRQDGGADPRLTAIERSAVRARELVQQILAFSRRQPPHPARQPLAPLVDDALAMLRRTLPAQVRLSAPRGDEPIEVEADGNQIHQVLMNLCTNAWHAIGTAPGHIEVGLDTTTWAQAGLDVPGQTPDGRCAHLWVKDDGCGMDAATRERIFEPFFTTKPVGSGTGLGLAVVHGIVGEHRGQIVVDSAPGAGATFHVYLPLSPPAPLADAAEAAEAEPLPGPSSACTANAASASGRERGPPARVLFVDDDDVMRLTGEGLLRNAGFEVTAVGSGPAALEAVRAAPAGFDLVVSDYNMPGWSGLDIARELATLRPDLPVVLCSGYIDAELLARAEQAGIRALVHKENAAVDLAPAARAVLAPH